MASDKNQTTKVLGDISAMQTLTEFFPMHILDGYKGKQYTSAFDFVFDCLEAIGMTQEEIISYLVNNIFGFEAKANSLYDTIRDADFESLEQSNFLKTLERGIKDIIMALLSKVYTCSAIPVLPNKVFDSDDLPGLMDKIIPSIGKSLKDLIDERVFDERPDFPLDIPVSLIDTMGMLSINPFSDDGPLYYDIEGRLRYYKKEMTKVTRQETQLVENKTVKRAVRQVYKYKKAISLILTNISEGKYVLTITEPLDNDLKIEIRYISASNPNLGEQTVTKTITAGQTESDVWNVVPNRGEAYTVISSFRVNGNNNYIEIGNSKDTTENTCVYLSKENLFNLDPAWADEGWSSIGLQKDTEFSGKIDQEYEEVVTTPRLVVINKDVISWDYVECERKDITTGNEFVRKNAVPEAKNVTENDPEFIAVWEGITPNTLYRTKDMNAFIWYVFHKGSKTPYSEYNHMMWDSRISAEEEGVERKSDEDWNRWYDSKKKSTSSITFPDEEFTLSGNRSDILYPILQMEPNGNRLKLHIPSQRYFAPKIRKKLIQGGTPNEKLNFNASIYKYNWDYLQSIRILNPKLLIYKMCQYLLNFSMSTIQSFNVSLTQKMIQAKLSTAIKKMVEADDMEIEDCYTSFSNDEFNELIEEMLLQKYNASWYGGETSTIRVHNVNDYLSTLDKISSAASVEGNVEQITKLITDVSVDPETEGQIDYGLKVNFDGNILKRLLWGITEPIMESLFTPQIMLLFQMNFNLTGMVKTEDTLGEDLGKFLNLLINKLLGLMKSIIIYVKEKLVALLIILFKVKLEPLLIKWLGIQTIEMLKAWRQLLSEAAECLRQFKFGGNRNKTKAEIDDVDYADIIVDDTQNTPESTSTC